MLHKRLQPLGSFRMSGACIVLEVIGVINESKRAHGILRWLVFIQTLKGRPSLNLLFSSKLIANQKEAGEDTLLRDISININLPTFHQIFTRS
jgi:hypothetical protein